MTTTEKAILLLDKAADNLERVADLIEAAKRPTKGQRMVLENAAAHLRIVQDRIDSVIYKQTK